MWAEDGRWVLGDHRSKASVEGRRVEGVCLYCCCPSLPSCSDGLPWLPGAGLSPGLLPVVAQQTIEGGGPSSAWGTREDLASREAVIVANLGDAAEFHGRRTFCLI